MSIVKDAKQRFLEADLAVKKHLLSVLLSNCLFRDRKISASYRKPFDIIVKTAPGQPPENRSARGRVLSLRLVGALPGPHCNELAAGVMPVLIRVPRRSVRSTQRK